MLRLKERKKEQMCKVKEVDKEDLYILKNNCKGKSTVGKANKGINLEKIMIGLKNQKLNFLKERKKKKTNNLPRTAKAQHRGRGL